MAYIGYSMSMNAAMAYDGGEKPLSKWTKEALLSAAGEKAELLKPLTVAELRDLILYKSSWHHTSCKFNRTDFYAADDEAIDAATEETVRRIIEARKPREKKAKEEPKLIRAEVTYTVWEGRYARYRRPRKVTELVTYMEGEKMIRTSDGMKRLSSMERVRELGDDEQ